MLDEAFLLLATNLLFMQRLGVVARYVWQSTCRATSARSLHVPDGRFCSAVFLHRACVCFGARRFACRSRLRCVLICSQYVGCCESSPIFILFALRAQKSSDARSERARCRCCSCCARFFAHAAPSRFPVSRFPVCSVAIRYINRQCYCRNRSFLGFQ